MEHELKLLKEMKLNIDKRVINLRRLVKQAEEGSLKVLLKRQLQGYQRHRNKIASYLVNYHDLGKELSVWDKAYLKTLIRVKTWRKPSTTKLVKTLIHDFTNDIITVNQSIRQHGISDERTALITNSYLKFAQSSIEQVKEYLI